MSWIERFRGKKPQQQELILDTPEKIDAQYFDYAARILRQDPKNYDLMRTAYNELTALRDIKKKVHSSYHRDNRKLMRLVRAAALQECQPGIRDMAPIDRDIELYLLEKAWGRLADSRGLWGSGDRKRFDVMKKRVYPQRFESSRKD